MLEREIHGDVAVLRMAHGKASALDLEFLEGLALALEEERGARARALVLTGTGSIFSAGVDLLRIRDGGRGYIEAFLPALERALLDLFTLEKPVVAALNGHAIAGGAVLACAADLRIMSRGKGTFGIPELKVGVPFPLLALEIVRTVIPPPAFQEAVLLTRTYTGDEIAARGWVSEIVEPEVLLPRAIAAAADLARVPPQSFAGTKLLMRRPALDALAQHGPRVARDVLQSWCSPEVLAAVRDYVARTIKK